MQPNRTWARASTNLHSWLSINNHCPRQIIRCISSIPTNIQQHPSEVSTQDDTTPAHRKVGKRSVAREEKLKRRKPVDSPSRTTQALHNDREIVDPLSLEKTLQAHQRANRDAIDIKHVGTNSTLKNTPAPLWHKYAKRTAATHLSLGRENTQDGGGQWEDYLGKPRPLSLDWELVGPVAHNLRTPWMNELDKRQFSRETAATRLSEEIRVADVFFSPSQTEWNAANQAVKELETFILSVDPSFVKLDVIGSRSSGLATPLSDLDLNLVISSKKEHEPPNPPGRILGKLSRTMRWSKHTEDRFTISYFASGARVPIIVGTHVSGLEFQIQSASSGYGSLEVVKGLCAEYPTLRALFKITKQMLKMRGLCDGPRGGLTSYPLINMIAVSLKRNATTADPFDYGQHLLQFLEYWSTINLYETGITHIPGSSFKSKDANAFKDPETAAKSISLITQDPVGATPVEFDVRKNLAEIHTGQNNFMMTLHDPANPHNDLGRSASAIKHIQSTFTKVLKQLKMDLEACDKDLLDSSDTEKKPPSLLRSLIEGDYSLYNLERKRITKQREFVQFESDPEVDAKFLVR